MPATSSGPPVESRFPVQIVENEAGRRLAHGVLVVDDGGARVPVEPPRERLHHRPAPSGHVERGPTRGSTFAQLSTERAATVRGAQTSEWVGAIDWAGQPMA